MKWFDHIYIINLDSRKDRLEKVSKEFENLGYSFERVSAVDGDVTEINYIKNDIPGWNKNAAALLETTINILKDAKEKNYNKILICEDDLFFSENAKVFLENYNFPEDAMWDMFFFGAMHEWNPLYLNNDTVRLKKSYCCHCYAIHSRVYDDYINLLSKKDMPIDWVTSECFMVHGRCLATKDPIAFQKPDYSNIRKKQVHNIIN